MWLRHLQDAERFQPENRHGIIKWVTKSQIVLIWARWLRADSHTLIVCFKIFPPTIGGCGNNPYGVCPIPRGATAGVAVAAVAPKGVVLAWAKLNMPPAVGIRLLLGVTRLKVEAPPNRLDVEPALNAPNALLCVVVPPNVEPDAPNRDGAEAAPKAPPPPCGVEPNNGAALAPNKLGVVEVPPNVGVATLPNAGMLEGANGDREDTPKADDAPKGLEAPKAWPVEGAGELPNTEAPGAADPNVLAAPNEGEDATPNTWAEAPKAGVLAAPKPGVALAPKAGEEDAPKGVELPANTGADVPNGEAACAPNAEVDAAPKAV